MNEVNCWVVKEISPDSFMSFSSCHGFFFQNTMLLTSTNIFWICVTKIREIIISLMCRKPMVQGTTHLASKSVALHLAPSVWTYLWSKLVGTGVAVRNYTQQSQKVIWKYGLTLQSVRLAKSWEHIQFESKDDINCLEQVIGNSIIYGIEKPRITTRMRYMLALHENDTCHIIQPADQQTLFCT